VSIEGPHKDDLFLLQHVAETGRSYGMWNASNVTPDRWLEEGDQVQIGELLLVFLWRAPVQLAFRVSSTSVTVITPGAGCSITSAATVSTTGATGRFTFRAAFFTGAGLGLAVRFVAFAALDTLRALPRAVAAFLFCAFDCFFRLAMIRPSPGWWSATHDVGSMSLGNPSNELSPDFSSSAP
jgi:hypothetical protein